MKLSIAFALFVSAAMAGIGAYIGAHPEALTKASGIEAFDNLNLVAARYGQTSSAMILVRSTTGTMIDRAPLEALAGLTHRLKNSGYCKTVLGVAQLPQIDLDEEGAEIRDLIERPPTSDAEREAIEVRVRKHPNAVGELISPDLKLVLLICPLSEKGNLATLGPIISVTDEAISARFVGPLGLASALGDDLTFSAILFVVLGLMIAIAERKPRHARASMMFIAVLLQAAIVLLAQPILWRTPMHGLKTLLGPGSAQTMTALDRVTGADHLVLVDVQGDFTEASDLQRLTSFCASLDGKWVISCPTDVLGTMAQALAGTSEMPKTNEQLRALWFFGGDRAELSMVFTPDKHGALLRVRIPDGGDLTLLDRDLEAGAAGLSYVRGGIPYIERLLDHSRIYLISLFLALAAVSAVLGRAMGWDRWQLGEVLLAPALLVKVGLASRVLLVIGLLVLFASVGARTRKSLEPESATG